MTRASADALLASGIVPRLDNLEYVLATYSTYVFPPHVHDHFAIGIVETGIGAVWCRGTNHVCPPGTVIVIAPGDVHTGGPWKRGRRMTYRMMYIAGALLSRVLSEKQVATALARAGGFVGPDQTLAVAVRRAHAALCAGEDPLARDEHVVAMLVRLNRSGSRRRNGANEPRALTIAREYLLADLSRNVPLLELARVVGLHPTYLVEVFKTGVGLPPHSYVTHARIARARTLLIAGDSPASVAAAVGFSDQSHLTRHFRRLTGLAPGYFQRVIRSEDRSRPEPSP